MAEKEVTTTLRFTERGMEVIDEAGRKLGMLTHEAEKASHAGASGFSGWQASAISFNQTMDLVNRGYHTFVNLTSAPIGAAANVEALQTRLLSLKGSQEAAAASYASMVKLADSTPFNLNSVVEAGVTLESFTKQSDLTLGAVTNLAAFMGTSAPEAAAAFGRAWAGGVGAADILRERGVLQIVKDFTQIDDLTKVSLPQFREALFDSMGDPRIAGAAEALSKTWLGLTNNVEDATGKLLTSLGNVIIKSEALRSGGATLKAGIEGIATNVDAWATANRGVIDSGLTEFMDELGRIGRVVLPVLEAMWKAVQGIRSAGNFVGDVVAPFVAGYGTPQTFSARDRIAENRAAIDAMHAANRPSTVSQLIPEGGSTSFFGDPFAVGQQSDAPLFGPAGAASGRPDFGKDHADAAKGIAAAQKVVDQQGQAAAQAVNDLLRERQTLFQSEAELRQQSVKFAADDLQLAEQRGASEAELFGLAQRLDALERERVQHALAQAEAQRDLIQQWGPFIGATAADLTESAGKAELLRREFERTGTTIGANTEALQRQRDVVVNLGEAANTALGRVVDGILSGGGSFDLASIARDTVRTIASDLIGGLIEANANGGELVVEGWSESLNQVEGLFRGVFEGILANTGVFGSTLAGLLGTAGSAGSASAGGRVEDAFGTSFAGPGAQAVADAQGGISGGGLSSIAGALPIVGAVIGAAQFAIEQVNAFRSGIKEANKGRWERGASNDELVAQAFTKDFAGKFWSSIFGDKIGGDINQSFLTGGFGSDSIQSRVVRSFVAPGSGAIDLPFKLFQPKTSGTITKQELSGLYSDANVARQRFLEGGGREGIRIPFLETPLTEEDLARLRAAGFDKYGGTFQGKRPGQAEQILANAQPGVRELNTGAGLGLASVLGNNEQEIFNIVSTMTNNFAALGVSEKEARRELLQLAQAAGVDLVNGLDELQKKYLEGDLTQKQLMSSAAGLVDLFSDKLPAGIDLAALSVANFTEQGGLDLATFTEDVQRAVDIFGRLQDTVEGGLGGGIQAGIVAYGGVAQAKENYLTRNGTLGEWQKAYKDAQEQFLEPFVTSIYQGVLDAMSASMLDAVKETPAWDAMTAAIAAAVNGTGDAGAIFAQMPNILSDLGPMLENAALVTSAIGDAIAVLPSTLRGDAGSIDAQIKSIKYGELNRPNQLSFLRNELGDIDSQLAALSDGQGGYIDPVKARDLLEQRRDIGYEFVSQAQQQYAFGTQARGSGVAYGVDILEDTSAMLSDFADEQKDALTGNTGAIDRNTAQLSRMNDNGITLTINHRGGDGDTPGGGHGRRHRDGDLGEVFWELLQAALTSPRGERLIRNIESRP